MGLQKDLGAGVGLEDLHVGEIGGVGADGLEIGALALQGDLAQVLGGLVQHVALQLADVDVDGRHQQELVVVVVQDLADIAALKDGGDISADEVDVLHNLDLLEGHFLL